MIVLIGSNGSLGSAITEQICQREQSVFCLSRRKPGNFHPNLQFKNCDVSKLNEFTSQLEKIISQNKIKAVIYNAAVSFSSHDLKSLTEKQLLEMVNVNILATTKILQTLERKTYTDGEFLRFIYISSNSVKTLNASNPFYTASKAASEHLVLNFAKRMGRYCSANIVRPGLMRSKLTEARFDKAMLEVLKSTPSNRLASPEETAKVVVNLILDIPPTLTGQILSVDGGRTI